MRTRLGARWMLASIVVAGCTGEMETTSDRPDGSVSDATPVRDGALPSPADAASDPPDGTLGPADSGVADDDASVVPTPPIDGGHAELDAAPTEPDAGMIPPEPDAGGPPIPMGGCPVLFEQSGLVHESVESNLKARIRIAVEARSYDAIEVDLDVHHGGWTRDQGQHELFTLLRADRWVGNAVAYVAAAGGERRFTVLVSNLDLPGAAAPDGRRITRNYGYEPGAEYHLEYRYDAALESRRLRIHRDGAVVSTIEGSSTIAMTRVPTVDVEDDHFVLLLGGEEILDAPDASTLGWRFSNVVVRGCAHE